MGEFVEERQIIGEYQDIIEVDHDVAFIDHVLEYVVHECLECGRGIA
jgi:hypothetical protein